MPARRHLAALPSALFLALALAGCQSPSTPSFASVPNPPPPSDQERLRAYADEMGPRYSADPDNRAVALRYAMALRGLTRHAQAVAVLQRLAVKNPHDTVVLGAYGKALADAGRLQEAADVLERAHAPDRPNWTILSAQGSVADQMGDHARARDYYAAALKIVPNQPQVLSNLGLSYALERRMPQAEQTLRDAAAQPAADARVRENLALVLSLQGKYAEAEEVSRRDMAPIDAAENVQSIKRMIAQSDTWQSGARKDKAHPPRRATASAERSGGATRTAAADDLQ